MPVPTATASNALSRLSDIRFTNHSAINARVASVAATTITLDNTDAISANTLDTPGNPGMVVVKTGVAAADEGLTSNITGFTGNVLTVPINFTTNLADGSIVSIFPPHSIKLATNGGHTLQL